MTWTTPLDTDRSARSTVALPTITFPTKHFELNTSTYQTNSRIKHYILSDIAGQIVQLNTISYQTLWDKWILVFYPKLEARDKIY